MSYNNYYMRLRVKAVQEFDRMYHEPEYKAKCHKRVWKRLGCYIFGISYQSYLDYHYCPVKAGKSVFEIVET